MGKEERFYDFVCPYVRRMVPDVKWKKKMKQNPEHPVFSFITPSDIAYVIALIMNGRDVWDQAKRLMSNPDAEPEKKEKPLFSTGEGKKRESGKSVWNNEGLEFYYSVEKKWRATYNSKEEFTAMANGWEKWEPREKSKKDPLRTVWKHEQKKTNMDGSEGRSRWWETEGEGYDTDLDLAAHFVWDKDVLKKWTVKRRALREAMMTVTIRVLPKEKRQTKMTIMKKGKGLKRWCELQKGPRQRDSFDRGGGGRLDVCLA